MGQHPAAVLATPAVPTTATVLTDPTRNPQQEDSTVTRYARPKARIDDVLREFFVQQRQVRPIQLDRSLRLEAHLRRFLEACGPAYLSEEWWMMLQLEQCFEPQDAFARLLPADHLLPPMHEFLSPDWLMDHGTDRLVQVNHSYRLVCWLCGSGLVNLRALRPSIIRFMIRHDELSAHSKRRAERQRIPRPAGAPQVEAPQADAAIRREDLP